MEKIWGILSGMLVYLASKRFEILGQIGGKFRRIFRKQLRFKFRLFCGRVVLSELQTHPNFAQPAFRRSNGSHPQREGTTLGVFVPVWLVLLQREATNLGVFDLCHFDVLKQGRANSGGFGAR